MAMTPINRILAIACALPALLAAAPANETKKTAGKKTDVPLTQIAVIALGPEPVRRYGERGQMLRARPGETPPPKLYYRGAKRKTKGGKKKETAWKSFNLRFNSRASMREFPSGKEIVLHRRLPGGEGYEPYVTIPAGAEGARRVFFLTPADVGPSPWSGAPKACMLDLGARGLRNKEFILRNLSEFTVLHAFEGTVASVAPMQTTSYTRPKVGELYRLAARYGNHKKIIYNTAVRLGTRGDIQLFVLYNANPATNSGRSVGVFRMVVPAPLAKQGAAEEP